MWEYMMIRFIETFPVDWDRVLSMAYSHTKVIVWFIVMNSGRVLILRAPIICVHES